MLLLTIWSFSSGLLLVSMMVWGLVNIMCGGFLQVVLCSLLAALFVSLILSGLANMCLVEMMRYQSNAELVILAKSIFAAIAQPTLTGLILIAIMFILAIGISHMVGIIEVLSVLLSSQREYIPRRATSDNDEKARTTN